MKSPHFIALLFATTLISQAKAQAASISWNTITSITGDSDVSTNGMLVHAYNFGNYTTTLSPATNVTINGVTFLAGNNNSVAEGITHDFDVSLGNSPYGSTVAPFTNLSANYQNLLANGVQSSDLNTRTLTLQQLVAGSIYEVQIWVNNSSVTGSHNEIISSGGSTGLLYPDNLLGEYVTGTFVADSSGTQTISFISNSLSPYIDKSTQINALQLRLIPEPASALFSTASLILLALRRRRA